MITCTTASYINQKNAKVMLSIPRDLWEVIEQSEEWRKILCAEDLTKPKLQPGDFRKGVRMSEIEKYLKEQEKRVEALVNENRERMEFREKELGYIRELIKMVSSEKPERKTNSLSNYKTCELVEELKTREGVETHWAEPYEDKNIQVNGPALVLVVID